MSEFEIRHISRIAEIPAESWNALVDSDNPFLTHEFLNALESTGCVSRDSGWLPTHIVAESDGKLLGAMPLYLKYHSYGEYVFDWAWADAYERAGMRYYPKLLCSIPFTPVTGQRLLINETLANGRPVGQKLIEAVMSMAEDRNLSSIHWLFTNPTDTALLKNANLMLRRGSQFHWSNHGFKDFDEYLTTFSSKRRKNIRRERRRVADQGIAFECISADELKQEHWDAFYEFYTSTIESRGAIPYLNREFFYEIGSRMPNSILLTLARIDRRYVAGALYLKGDKTLYGRYWGASEIYDDLHFETCYYQGIEYCINHGLSRFEAGAQGEHKLNRGLLPTATWSAHWISHEGFADAVAEFLEHEKPNVDRYIEVLTNHGPFRKTVSKNRVE